MKKPLLTAQEFDLLKDFPVDNLSLIPKLIHPPPLKIISVPHTQEINENNCEDKLKLFAELTGVKVLNGETALRPIYCYDFSVIGNEKNDFEYQPGDSFGFYPELSDEEVKYLGERLEISLEDLIEITGPPALLSEFFPNYKISSPTDSITIKSRELLSRLDIRGFPKKAVLRSLAEYCQDEDESSVLLFLSSRNGSDAYNRLRTEMLSAQILLSALDSLKPPLAVLAGLLGPLQVRYYSCCRMQRGNSFQIVFNVTETETDAKVKIKGVCSAWLESLGKSTDNSRLLPIPIIKRSIGHFKLPETLVEIDAVNSAFPDRPIIMIATGTGLAPFIGFLEVLSANRTRTRTTRTRNQDQDQDQVSSSPFTWLIFGCRNSSDDFIFKEELEMFKAEGTLSRLSLAISRDPVQPKMYVQDVIKNNDEEFYKLLIEKDAIIYVCGDELKMIKGVNDSVIDLLMKNQVELGLKEAEGILMKWTKDKKIIRDIWI